MFQIQSKSGLKGALLLGAATAAAMSLSDQALAQDQSQQKIETVVVTGSRIPQVGLISASPVTAVSNQDIKLQGKTDVVDILNQLPQVVLDQSDSSNNGQSGTANVDLRGLGAKRTLVLVNGTRLMPGDPLDPAPDINVIPAVMVDHIEVLTGGASAVYGSDAMAGVVNFIMRKDFEGAEFTGQLSGDWADNTDQQDIDAINRAGPGYFQAPQPVMDGGVADASLVVGSNSENDKGNVTGYLTYHRQSPIFWQARDYGACTMSNASASTSGGASVSVRGHQCLGSSNKNRFTSIDVQSTGKFSSSKSRFYEDGNGPGNNFGTVGGGKFVRYIGGPTQTFNFGALNLIQRPDTRYTGGFFGHYEVNKSLDIYSSFMFMDDYTAAIAAPTAAFGGAGPIPTLANGSFFAVNCTNPGLTPDNGTGMTTSEQFDLCGSLQASTLDKNGVPLSTDFPTGPYGHGFDTFHPAGSDATAIALGHGYWDGQANQVPGQSTLDLRRRLVENGLRIQTQQHTDYRAQFGARGDLFDDWTYDVSGQIGEARFVETQFGDASKTNIENALQVTPTTPGHGVCTGTLTFPPTASGCVPLNFFDGLGAVTKPMLDYIDATGTEYGHTRELVASAVFTGDLSPWGGKSPWAKDPIGASFGVDYLDEQLQVVPDHELDTNDLAGFGGAVHAHPLASLHVAEGFFELKVPIIQDAPYAEAVTAHLGYRHSAYSPSGPADTWKADLEWQPVDDFKIRGGINRAFRAPSVLELFTPQSFALFSGFDPCASRTTGQCAGVVGAGSGPNGQLACPANQCNSAVGGNEALKPEIAMTETIGIVFTPTFIENFSATIDYYNVKITNSIGAIPANETLQGCYGAAATPGSEAFFCPAIHRDPQTGAVFGSGFVSATNVNSGFLEVRGIDVEANYSTDLDDWGLVGDGGLAFNFQGSYAGDNITQSNPILGTFDCAGLYGPTCGVPDPHWRHKLRATWTSPWDVDLSLNWRFFGATHIDINSPNPLLAAPAPVAFPLTSPDTGNDSHIPMFNWFDIAADWHYTPNVDLRFGINNVFGKDAPTVSAFATPLPFGNANTFPGTYDYLGRQFFLAVTLKD